MRKLALPLRKRDIDTRESRERACRMIAGELFSIALAEKSHLENLSVGSFPYCATEYAASELSSAARLICDAYGYF